MQPDAVLLADRAELGQGVDGGRRRRPDRGADQDRRVAAVDVALEPGGERAGPHGQVLVDLDDADGVGAQAGDPDGLLHRRVGLGGHVHGGAIGVDARADRGARAGAVQGGQEGDQVGAGAGVLDHAAAGAGGAEGGGQAEELGEPVHDVLLELGGRRTGHPRHALDAEARGDQVAEDRRPGGVGREVAEEAGVLPVRRPREHDPVEVGEDRRDRRAALGGGRREGRADLAGGDLRAHREGLDPGPVVGDPVHDLVAVLPELLGSHVRCRLGHGTNRIGRRRPKAASGGRARCLETWARVLSRRVGPGGRISAGRDLPWRGAPGGVRAGETQRLNAAGERLVAAVSSGGRQLAQCPRCDSNAHCAGFESAPSADWGTGAGRSPGASAAYREVRPRLRR